MQGTLYFLLADFYWHAEFFYWRPFKDSQVFLTYSGQLSWADFTGKTCHYQPTLSFMQAPWPTTWCTQPNAASFLLNAAANSRWVFPLLPTPHSFPLLPCVVAFLTPYSRCITDHRCTINIVNPLTILKEIKMIHDVSKKKTHICVCWKLGLLSEDLGEKNPTFFSPWLEM